MASVVPLLVAALFSVAQVRIDVVGVEVKAVDPVKEHCLRLEEFKGLKLAGVVDDEKRYQRFKACYLGIQMLSAPQATKKEVVKAASPQELLKGLRGVGTIRKIFSSNKQLALEDREKKRSEFPSAAKKVVSDKDQHIKCMYEPQRQKPRLKSAWCVGTRKDDSVVSLEAKQEAKSYYACVIGRMAAKFVDMNYYTLRSNGIQKEIYRFVCDKKEKDRIYESNLRYIEETEDSLRITDKELMHLKSPDAYPLERASWPTAVGLGRSSEGIAYMADVMSRAGANVYDFDDSSVKFSATKELTRELRHLCFLTPSLMANGKEKATDMCAYGSGGKSFSLEVHWQTHHPATYQQIKAELEANQLSGDPGPHLANTVTRQAFTLETVQRWAAECALCPVPESKGEATAKDAKKDAKYKCVSWCEKATVTLNTESGNYGQTENGRKLVKEFFTEAGGSILEDSEKPGSKINPGDKVTWKVVGPPGLQTAFEYLCFFWTKTDGLETAAEACGWKFAVPKDDSKGSPMTKTFINWLTIDQQSRRAIFDRYAKRNSKAKYTMMAYETAAIDPTLGLIQRGTATCAFGVFRSDLPLPSAISTANAREFYFAPWCKTRVQLNEQGLSYSDLGQVRLRGYFKLAGGTILESTAKKYGRHVWLASARPRLVEEFTRLCLWSPLSIHRSPKCALEEALSGNKEITIKWLTDLPLKRKILMDEIVSKGGSYKLASAASKEASSSELTVTAKLEVIQLGLLQCVISVVLPKTSASVSEAKESTAQTGHLKPFWCLHDVEVKPLAGIPVQKGGQRYAAELFNQAGGTVSGIADDSESANNKQLSKTSETASSAATSMKDGDKSEKAQTAIGATSTSANPAVKLSGPMHVICEFLHTCFWTAANEEPLLGGCGCVFATMKERHLMYEFTWKEDITTPRKAEILLFEQSKHDSDVKHDDTHIRLALTEKSAWGLLQRRVIGCEFSYSDHGETNACPYWCGFHENDLAKAEILWPFGGLGSHESGRRLAESFFGAIHGRVDETESKKFFAEGSAAVINEFHKLCIWRRGSDKMDHCKDLANEGKERSLEWFLTNPQLIAAARAKAETGGATFIEEELASSKDAKRAGKFKAKMTLEAFQKLSLDCVVCTVASGKALIDYQDCPFWCIKDVDATWNMHHGLIAHEKSDEDKEHMRKFLVSIFERHGGQVDSEDKAKQTLKIRGSAALICDFKRLCIWSATSPIDLPDCSCKYTDEDFSGKVPDEFFSRLVWQPTVTPQLRRSIENSYAAEMAIPGGQRDSGALQGPFRFDAFQYTQLTCALCLNSAKGFTFCPSFCQGSVRVRPNLDHASSFTDNGNGRRRILHYFAGAGGTVKDIDRFADADEAERIEVGADGDLVEEFRRMCFWCLEAAGDSCVKCPYAAYKDAEHRFIWFTNSPEKRKQVLQGIFRAEAGKKADFLNKGTFTAKTSLGDIQHWVSECAICPAKSLERPDAPEPLCPSWCLRDVQTTWNTEIGFGQTAKGKTLATEYFTKFGGEVGESPPTNADKGGSGITLSGSRILICEFVQLCVFNLPKHHVIFPLLGCQCQYNTKDTELGPARKIAWSQSATTWKRRESLDRLFEKQNDPANGKFNVVLRNKGQSMFDYVAYKGFLGKFSGGTIQRWTMGCHWCVDPDPLPKAKDGLLSVSDWNSAQCPSWCPTAVEMTWRDHVTPPSMVEELRRHVRQLGVQTAARTDKADKDLIVATEDGRITKQMMDLCLWCPFGKSAKPCRDVCPWKIDSMITGGHKGTFTWLTDNAQKRARAKAHILSAGRYLDQPWAVPQENVKINLKASEFEGYLKFQWIQRFTVDCTFCPTTPPKEKSPAISGGNDVLGQEVSGSAADSGQSNNPPGGCPSWCLRNVEVTWNKEGMAKSLTGQREIFKMFQQAGGSAKELSGADPSNPTSSEKAPTGVGVREKSIVSGSKALICEFARFCFWSVKQTLPGDACSCKFPNAANFHRTFTWVTGKEKQLQEAKTALAKGAASSKPSGKNPAAYLTTQATLEQIQRYTSDCTACVSMPVAKDEECTEDRVCASWCAVGDTMRHEEDLKTTLAFTQMQIALDYFSAAGGTIVHAETARTTVKGPRYLIDELVDYCVWCPYGDKGFCPDTCIFDDDLQRAFKFLDTATEKDIQEAKKELGITAPAASKPTDKAKHSVAIGKAKSKGAIRKWAFKCVICAARTGIPEGVASLPDAITGKYRDFMCLSGCLPKEEGKKTEGSTSDGEKETAAEKEREKSKSDAAAKTDTPLGNTKEMEDANKDKKSAAATSAEKTKAKEKDKFVEPEEMDPSNIALPEELPDSEFAEKAEGKKESKDEKQDANPTKVPLPTEVPGSEFSDNPEPTKVPLPETTPDEKEGLEPKEAAGTSKKTTAKSGKVRAPKPPPINTATKPNVDTSQEQQTPPSSYLTANEHH